LIARGIEGMSMPCTCELKRFWDSVSMPEFKVLILYGEDRAHYSEYEVYMTGNRRQ
jgi:hypothetical protein